MHQLLPRTFHDIAFGIFSDHMGNPHSKRVSKKENTTVTKKAKKGRKNITRKFKMYYIYNLFFVYNNLKRQFKMSFTLISH